MAGLAETIAALVKQPAWPTGEGHDVGLHEVTGFGANPGELRMRLHVPEDLAPGAALVVVLHGCTQTAAALAAGAGWLDLADRHGFVVICPEQTRANNPNLCFNWFQPQDTARGHGEAASIHAMIEHAVATFELDPRRVFVTGLSAGGAMAGVMLATYPETFAAGAVVAGLPFGAAANMQEAFAAMSNARSLPAAVWGDKVRAASSHAGPWPRVSVWQGEADTTVRPGVADDLVRQWTDVHGLRSAGVEAADSDPGHRHLVWRRPDGEVGVELHRIAGMGHGVPLGCALPDGCGTAGPYLLEVGISSSQQIARSWGLTASRHRPRRRPALAGADATSPTPTHPDPVQRLQAEIGRTISDALRSAGLLK